MTLVTGDALMGPKGHVPIRATEERATILERETRADVTGDSAVIDPRSSTFSSGAKSVYRASNALSLSFTSCPDLEHFTLALKDGHQLSIGEVFAWIEAALSEGWQHGPPEVRRQKLKQVMSQQPRG